MLDSKLLSIAICTYNRAEQLKPLLQQFEGLADSLWPHIELLLIDNNSSDATQEVAAGCNMPFEFRILREDKQGLSNARNCALQNFSGDAILFFDDDVSITHQCLETYISALASWPAAGYFGGPIEVDWQGPAPSWLKSNDLSLLSGLFGQYQPAAKDSLYDGSIFDPYGANFMLRRSTVDKVGLFDTSLGVNGEEIGRGEETDYFSRARQLGVQGQYLVLAAVGHRFQTERVTIPYLYRYGIEKGRATMRTGNTAPSSWVLNSIVFAVKGVWQLLKGRRDRMYQCVINIGILRGSAKAGRT